MSPPPLERQGHGAAVRYPPPGLTTVSDEI